MASPATREATAVATAERRQKRRFPMQLQVNWRALGTAEEAGCGLTCDISASGLYLRGEPGALKKGSPVELNVRLPLQADGRPIDMHGVGRVVRIERNGGEELGVAVEFDRIELWPDDLESLT